MIRLQLLGSLALLDEGGNPVQSLLAQPKRFALLAYLAASPSPAAHRRDTLLGMFWPELDEEHARQALRQALYGLRQSLGPGVIVGTGEELVSVDGQQLWCDAAAFAAAVKGGRDEDALELYRGPFLEGFHVSGVPAFERWVEVECRRFGLIAVQAAWRQVERAAGDRSKARQWAERALELAPYDEEGLRRYLGLMAEHGQPAAAARAYEAFAKRLAAELDLEPSAETVALAERIRARARSGGRRGPPSETPVRSLDAPAARVSPTAATEARAAESATAAPAAPPALTPSLMMVRSRRLRRVALLTAPMVVLLGGVLLLYSAGEAPRAAGAPTAHSPRALAVLPFQNLSTEPAHAYFAAGLHDELLTQLSKVADLSLRGRSSVVGYAGTTKSVRQIAQELAVGTLVGGSVQVVGDRLRVNVQLIDAAADEHRWAESYDRTLDDAFAIQSDIAQQIVAAVGAALTGAERQELAEAPTANAEAYRLYLQGREYHTRPGYLQQNLQAAQQLYERAVTLDPSFALAHAELSEVHGWMYWWRYDPSPARAARQLEEAEAALRLAPDLPQAHVALGRARYIGRRDWRGALDEFAVALRALPNDADLHERIGWAHRRSGNWNEAIAAFEKATQLDPRDAMLFFDLGGYTYLTLHRYRDAARVLDRARTLAPDLHVAAVLKGLTYVLWQGQLDTLRAALRRIPRDAELAPLGTRWAQHVALLHWERRGDSLLHVLKAANVTVFEAIEFFLPKMLYTGWAHDLRGDRPAARGAFDSARVLLDSVIKQLPDDWRVHAARGLALAGLGRREAAVSEARWLQQSAAYRTDAFQGPLVAEDRARILAQVGEAEAALDEIERLLARPSRLSVHTLRLDPLWDPIREHPRFRALLARGE